MYYVNREQIELRLGAVTDIVAGLRRISTGLERRFVAGAGAGALPSSGD